MYFVDTISVTYVSKKSPNIVRDTVSTVNTHTKSIENVQSPFSSILFLMFWRKNKKLCKPSETQESTQSTPDTLDTGRIVLENVTERIFDELFKQFIDAHCDIGLDKYVQLDVISCAFGAFINDRYITTAQLTRIIHRNVTNVIIIDEKIVCGIAVHTFLTQDEFKDRTAREITLNRNQ